jgi:transcription elongation factor GreA
VEVPAPLSSAPIDLNVVGRWIEDLPDLTLDGARPAGKDLGARLNGFWLPDQTVVYIGMSTASIGSRVAAFVRTPLGERRPHAGGYWLKTLTGLERCRVWWAETDAAEEYEDALFGAFAATFPAEVAATLHDPAVILPFANLQTADRVRKHHGIAGGLRADEEGRPATEAERLAAAGKSGAGAPSGILRSRTVLRAGEPARRRTTTRATTTPRPRREAPAGGSGKAPRAPTRLSESGVAALRAELHELTTVTRPAIVARIAAARELGDLRENSEYHEARREQSFAEGRIRAIEDLLRHVEIIEEGHDEGRARLGSTIVVEGPHGDEEIYTLVGPSEAKPGAGRISSSSPIGAALLGGVAGDEVEAVVPSGRLRMRILEVR